MSDVGDDREEPFATLQSEVGAWSSREFPDQPAVNPLLGVGEELGELHETLPAGPSPTELDAVGDIIVYLADLCSRRDIDLQRAADRSPGAETFQRLDPASLDAAPLSVVAVALGRLQRSVLKRRQGIREDERRVGDDAEARAIALLLDGLARHATDRGYTLVDAVDAAWYDEVRDREWASDYKQE